jgi:hypothetical protein
MRDALTRAGLAAEIEPQAWARVWQRPWTVHVESIGTGEHATLYLSRYVYRVALTNRRLERFADRRVTFQYTHARTHTTRSLTLPVETFLTRFLDHVLPRGLAKVRWYGLLSPSRRGDLEHARRLIAAHAPRASATPTTHTDPPDAEPPRRAAAEQHAPSPAITGLTTGLTTRCPICSRGQRVLVQRYPPARPPPACPRVA